MTEKFEKIQRVAVEGLNEILGKPLKVLDDGFIRVIDYMGSDESIVQAARVSYGQGTKKVSEDRGLIRYLLRNKHTSPFEMCELKVHVRVSMDTWRQWIRHRMASINEYSTRYSLAIDSASKTAPDEWRLQSSDNKQGSEGYFDLETGEELSREESDFQNNARLLYEKRIEKGMAREQARKDLPLSTYTEAYWKIDLHNLLHFLKLRIDLHAQYEIREYARVLCDQVLKIWCPITYEAFNDYILHSTSFSSFEQDLLGMIANSRNVEAIKRAESLGWMDKDKDGNLKKNRERIEFEEKLKSLKIIIPW